MMPPFSYVGGKQGMAARIVGLIQPHDHYVEPFAGSLAVLLAKPPSMFETVNDIDGDLVNFWQVLRDRPDELVKACALTPHSRAEFADCRRRSPDPVEQARRTWVLLSQGRGGRLTRTGWRNIVTSAAGTLSMPGYLDAYLRRMIDVTERLRNVSLECRDGLEVIDSYDAPGAVFYVDQPYLSVTRRAHLYRHEMDDATHVTLLNALRACRGQVILSGYAHPLYDDALTGWERHEAPARASDGTARTEVVWTNRATETVLPGMERTA